MLFAIFLLQHTYMHVPASSEACRGYCHGADEHAHGELVACLASYLRRTSYFDFGHGGLLCKMRRDVTLGQRICVPMRTPWHGIDQGFSWSSGGLVQVLK